MTNEQLADQFIDLLNKHILTTRELIGVIADILINIGLSKTGADEVDAYEKVLEHLVAHRKQHGETPENALIAQGLLMQTWYSNEKEN